ncbi:MAG: hydrogenase iron-sulfur subunit [Deltaproteobacteria bacterium]|nr:hydrogenase iron-sulfur subunit [Deltaproteobacteria bacterium]
MVALGSPTQSPPEIVVLYCRQTLARDVKEPQGVRKLDGFNVRLVLLPCSSKVETPHFLRILETGAAGVLLVACPEKTCTFLVGNSRAERRIAYAQGLLAQVGMGTERLQMTRAADLTLEDLMELAARQAELVKPLGPNPMQQGGDQ